MVLYLLTQREIGIYLVIYKIFQALPLNNSNNFKNHDLLRYTHTYIHTHIIHLNLNKINSNIIQFLTFWPLVILEN